MLSIRQQPEDLRKPCLAYLMEHRRRPEMSEPARCLSRSAGIWARSAGRCCGSWRRRRRCDHLFGRFVKHPAGFALRRAPLRLARQAPPEIQLETADEDLACTPLMRGLADHGVTVAQVRAGGGGHVLRRHAGGIRTKRQGENAIYGAFALSFIHF